MSGHLVSPQGRALRVDLRLAAALFSFALILLTLFAQRAGVADGESAHLELARGYGRLLDALVHHGAGAVTTDDVRDALAGPRPAPLFPYGAAGYTWLLLARRAAAAGGPLCSELFSLRLPGILASASVSPLVYLLARGTLSRRWAVLAAVLALLGPRLLLDAVSLGGGGSLVASTLLALLLHRVALRTGSLLATLVSAFSLGAALSLSLSPLLLALPLVWTAFREESGADAARPGTFALPRPTLAWMVVAPLSLVLLSPRLRPLGPESFLTFFEQALSPSVLPVRSLGLLVPPLVPPRSHMLQALLFAVPSSTLVLALVGAATPTATNARDRGYRVCATVLLVGSLALPRALASYPSAWALVVPFLAIGAAHGVRFLAAAASRFWPAHLSPRAELAVVALSFVEPVAASSDFSSAAGATSWLVPAPRPDRFAPFDGALLGAVPASTWVLPAGRAVRVYAPAVSTEIWEAALRHGPLARGTTRARSEETADVLLLAGAARPRGGFRAVYEVQRAGRIVLTVYRRLASRPAA